MKNLFNNKFEVFMKNLTFFLASLILCFSIAHSQVPNVPIPLTVGPTPTYVNGYFSFTHNDYRLIVTTLGIDQNFNGQEDSGDVKPALYFISINDVMNGDFSGKVLKELDFASLPFPTRIYIDNIGNNAYVPNKQKIDKILLETGDIIASFNPFQNVQIPNDAYITSVNYANGYIFISVRGADGTFNQFYIIKENTNEMVFETATEPNPQQSLIAGNYLFILCEGVFGSNNSKLMVYRIKDFDQWEIEFVNTLELGDTGNHLALAGSDKLIVTMNGSHQIHIINIPDLTIEKTIATPTSGYDGPRESGIVAGNTIVTTAYDGNLHMFDFNGKNLGKIIVGDKLEGIFTYTFPNPNMNFNIVAATSPFEKNYSANDKVYLFVNFSDVEESNINTLNIYPNPASEFIALSFESDFQYPINISIIDNFGRVVAEYNFNLAGKDISIPAKDLPVGSYVARIVANGKILNLPFVIVR